MGAKKPQYEAETTFDICFKEMDKTHKEMAAQVEANFNEKGMNASDPEVQNDGRRMADALTLLSVLGHEIDKLRMRVAVLELAQDDPGASFN